MFRVFQEEKIVTAFMFTLLVTSVFLKIVLGILYQNMIRESDNMATTGNKMLRQCKLKFANCYQMSNGVANIPIFVDKFLNRMKWGPFTYETLYHLSGQAMLLSVVSAGVGICRSIMAGRTLGDILPFYIVSFFGLYLFFSISTVMDVKKKKRILKINLVDYLENHLSPRIEITRQDMEMLYGDTGTEGRVISGQIGMGGRSRGRQNRRTVELMPIGIRQPVDRLTLDEARNIEMEDDEDLEEITLDDSPEKDSAEVTEEELEALLKEFLTN